MQSACNSSCVAAADSPALVLSKEEVAGSEGEGSAAIDFVDSDLFVEVRAKVRTSA